MLVSPSVPFAPEPAEQFGPYRVIGKLGAGGMGVVYRARHAQTGEQVALKTVHVQGEAWIASFRREIHALRSLDHPGVVRIVADGLQAGRPYYAMEFLEGPTLRELRRSTRGGLGSHDLATRTASDLQPAASEIRSTPGQDAPPDPGAVEPPTRPELHAALSAIRSVCQTLAFVHGRGVVHRDLKPDNVVLTTGRGPVLLDFGIAAQSFGAHGRDVLEATGRVMGSPAYMAPEQIRGQSVDARADLYAIGCMLFECVTGRLPFGGDRTGLVLARKLREAPPSPRQFVPDVDPALELLILRLLAQRPKDRLGHADDVAAALAALGAESSLDVTAEVEPYLYRPELAGRRAMLEHISAVLSSARGGALATEASSAARAEEDAKPTRALAAVAMATMNVTRGERASAPSRGAVVLIGGLSGLGKTRLALEAATLASERGFEVITGQCVRVSVAGKGQSEEMREAPLHPLRSFLLAVADRCRADGRRSYDALLGARGAVLAPYEPELATLEGIDDYPVASEVSAEGAAVRLNEALAETMAAFSERAPLLLVLDDLQWADEPTQRFLLSLTDAFFARARVVVLATYRSEEMKPSLARLCESHVANVLRLGRLDRAAVERIASDMLAITDPNPELIDFLDRQTDGNPFFVAEYLRAAIARKLLVRDVRGFWRYTPSAEREQGAEPGRELARIPLPQEMREVVALRFEGLKAEGRRFAQMASVLGRDVDVRVLTFAMGRGDSEAIAAVEELVRRGVLEEPEPGRLRFAHDKLREFAYASIADDERRRLHATAARVLLERAAELGVEALNDAVLGHHFAEADEPARAIDHLERAAMRDLGGGASGDAVQIFERMVALDQARAEEHRESDVRAASWQRFLAEAQYNLGDLRAAERHGRAALRLLLGGPTLFDRRTGSTKLDRWLFSAECAGALGTQTAVLLGQGGRLSGSTSPERHRQVALVADTLAEVYFFMNDPIRASLASVVGVNNAALLGPSPELARGYAQLGVAASYVPSRRLARLYFDRAQSAASQFRDSGAQLAVDFMYGFWNMGEARWSDAQAQLTSAASLAGRLRNHRREEEAIALLAQTALFRARFDEALAHTVQLEALAKRTKNGQAESWYRGARITSLIAHGRTEEALTLLDEVAKIIERTGDGADIILQSQRGPIYLGRGEHALARRAATDCLDYARGRRPIGSQLLMGYAATCQTLFALWERERGARERRELGALAKASLDELHGLSRYFPTSLPAALRYRGHWRGSGAAKRPGCARSARPSRRRGASRCLSRRPWPWRRSVVDSAAIEAPRFGPRRGRS